MNNNLLTTKLGELKGLNRLGVMCHAVIGYPSAKDSVLLANGMIEAGADILELQIPFSDPMADGPLIMHANELALQRGISTAQSFEIISKVSEQNKVPIVVMTYFQIVHAYSVKQFVKSLVESKASGLIVPDLTPEADDIEGLAKACHAAGISFIPVVSPNTSLPRLKSNITRANNLLYCTARQGITGQKTKLDNPIYQFLEQIEAENSIAKAVGFGISKPSQVKELIGHAEVAVVGSAITEAINEGGIKSAIHLVGKLVSATNTNLRKQS